MSFFDIFCDYFTKMKNVYDLIAFCYCYLDENISNQIIFIGEYIGGSQEFSGESNPNLRKLNDMQMKLKKLFKRNRHSIFNKDLSFSRNMFVIKISRLQ